MAFIQILALAVLCVAVTGNRHRRQDSSPVPILKFVDQHNIDGSYTYGFESGDGTYKLETRLASGEVKGKYGYIDPDGVLREMVYGATEERGFISSLEQNHIGQLEQTKQVPSSHQNKLRNPSTRLKVQEQSRNLEDERKNKIVDGNIRIVNGRRAVIRKRARKLKKNQQQQQQKQQQSLKPRQRQQQQQLQQPSQPLQQLESRQENLTERQTALAALKKARQELKELQQNMINNNIAKSQQVNSFNGFSSHQNTKLKSFNDFSRRQKVNSFNNFPSQQDTRLNLQNPPFESQLPRLQQSRFQQQEAPRSQLSGRSFPQNQQKVQIQQQRQVQVQQQHNVQQPQHNVWAGHPAQNINLQDGSYSISYSG